MLTSRRIKETLEEYGYANSVICLHSSFKSFGPVERGPDTIIEGFLAAGNTLLAPAFFYDSEATPLNGNYLRNGIDYSERQPASVSYQSRPDQIEPTMGIIPKTMLTYRDAFRSMHPMNSFVAIGPHAQKLTQVQQHLNVYATYKQLLHEYKNSHVFLCGTRLTTCTPLHFAEELAGRTVCRRWALHNEVVQEIEAGGCSDGFENLRPLISSISHQFSLGRSRTLAFNFGELIQQSQKIMRDNPEITRCSDFCMRCEDAIAGGPVLENNRRALLSVVK